MKSFNFPLVVSTTGAFLTFKLITMISSFLRFAAAMGCMFDDEAIQERNEAKLDDIRQKYVAAAQFPRKQKKRERIYYAHNYNFFRALGEYEKLLFIYEPIPKKYKKPHFLKLAKQ